MDGSGKHSLTSGFICGIFKLALSILLIFRRFMWTVVVRGIGLLVLLVLYVDVSSRDIYK